MIQLEDWGWDADRDVRFQSDQARGLEPARIVEEQRDGYRVLTRQGIAPARAAGRLHHEALELEALPTVGDWVALERPPQANHGLVQRVLERRTALVRKGAGTRSVAQVVATNVDTVLLVTSLNADLEPRRIERYLAAVFESGATPVLLLNKADLCDRAETVLEAVQPVALGVPTHVVSGLSGTGLEALAPYLEPGHTLALVGSSGVGKSTLVNALADREEQLVRAIRATDDRGRHTTTARRLLRLPDGALLVDTPGMREFGLWNAEDGLDGTFEDVTALTGNCRFGDCAHGSEPGCAVRAAVEAGDLPAERLAAWQKLGREIAFERSKQDRRAALEQRRGFRRQTRMHRRAAQQRRRLRGES